MKWRTAAYAAVRISVFAFLALAMASAAELKTETLNAWNAYLGHQSLEVEKRAGNPDYFFWADADPSRYEHARSGSAVIAPMHESESLRVPSGLIHHWVGVVFIPDATATDVLSVTRDYVHYKDYYKPGVADAKLIKQSQYRDEFSIRFVNSSILSRTSLEGIYSSKFVQVDEKRWYSVSQTSRMQEIRDYGQRTEKHLSDDHGSGYIWRLYSTARLEERDGGVLFELEAVALSRDIPGALRWFVEPIVKRVSRESVEKSLNETGQAVRDHAHACAAQGSHARFGPSQIIVAGACSRSADIRHAAYSDFWDQGFTGDQSR